ncbi:MAG: ArdC-like ssDNA-binding domain-containing protein [Dehalococcoidales bacterium]|nr:ArdC-like ssDNA-binding domain-containing protein [Dehalococcoidales bacterium]
MVIYRPLQDQMNDFMLFGMSILVMGFIAGITKSLVTDEPEPEKRYVPMTGTKKPAVTVVCPICGEVIAVPEYNSVTRSEALKRHIDKRHSTIGLRPQTLLIEGGERVPAEYRDLTVFLRDPLPEYSLMTLLPAVEVEAGEKKIDAVMKQLKAGVEGIQDSYQFRLFLTTMAKFHDYSIGNQILIMLQKPEATRVAGFNTWKDLGRWVKKGEKGIAILAPVLPPKPKLEEKEEEEELKKIELSPVYFKVVHVFDLSQTEGAELPEFEVPVLTGEVNEELFVRLMDRMKSRGIRVSFESRPHLEPGIKGFYTHGEIWVRPEEPRAQQLKTLVHEIAHYYSEDVFRIPRQDAETIAESAAYVVGAHYGFDTGVRSFPYVALWARDKKVLDQNLSSIRRVAGTILEELEKAG